MRIFFYLLLTAALTMGLMAQAAPRLRVHAGDHSRAHTVASVTLPVSLQDYNALRNQAGETMDLQIDQNGQATFFVSELKAGATADFTLIQLPAGAPPRALVSTKTTKTSVQVSSPGLPPLTYHTIPDELPTPDIPPIYARGGYIHPVLSPTGRQVTDDYPPNHIHHHGIWYAWTKTKVGDITPDFWNMGQGKGTVEFVGLDDTWSGPVHGGWTSRHRHRELMSEARRVILQETWQVRVYQKANSSFPYSMFDIDSRQDCVVDTPLLLPTYHYGGTGIRGNRAWDGKEHAFFLTSEGITDRVTGNESRARWCYMGGMIDGRQTGIAIFCHPENYRYPQPVRLHPTEPYFSYAPQQLGQMEIKRGTPYVMRYRHVVFDGPPDPERLESMFQDYAHPPRVELLPN